MTELSNRHWDDKDSEARIRDDLDTYFEKQKAKIFAESIYQICQKKSISMDLQDVKFQRLFICYISNTISKKLPSLIMNELENLESLR